MPLSVSIIRALLKGFFLLKNLLIVKRGNSRLTVLITIRKPKT